MIKHTLTLIILIGLFGCNQKSTPLPVPEAEKIVYFETGWYGPNILNNDTFYVGGTSVSLAVDIPDDQYVDVVIQELNCDPAKSCLLKNSNPVCKHSNLIWRLGANNNWSMNKSGNVGVPQRWTFRSFGDNVSEGQLSLIYHGKAKVEVFENGNSVPVISKVVTWEE